jgi:c-di-GMP-binding flagellar brake protein YcgR
MRLHAPVGGIGERVKVRWLSSRGAAEVPCTIEAGVWADTWWLRPVGPPTIEQRRHYFRVDVAMPISIYADSTSKPLQGWAVDLSEGGVRAVTVDVDLVVGQRVRVTFDLDPGGSIDCDADVLRSAPDGDGFSTLVLLFHQPPDIVQERIRQFVFKSQIRSGARR